MDACDNYVLSEIYCKIEILRFREVQLVTELVAEGCVLGILPWETGLCLFDVE